MRKFVTILIAVIVLAAVVFGSYFLWDRASRVATDDLEAIVRRDSIPFDVGAIPDEFIDLLASHQVVLVGENHFLREHRELLTELLPHLYARGFRQYLFEWTQAADWLLADYVGGGGFEPDWTPPHDIGGATLSAIREFNRTLSPEDRIQVHAIDIVLPDYGGAQTFLASLALLSQHLTDPGPLADFLAGDHQVLEAHTSLLESLKAELEAGRAGLIDLWGGDRYQTVVEMVEVELMSLPVRALRESNYDESVRVREEAIKLLADRRIGDGSFGTLINFGSTHAQKRGLWGTDDVEWLGDYLVHRSQAAAGSVITVWVTPAHIVSIPGSGTPDFDLGASPTNEILRVMNRTWPDRSVFLPLDDSLFSTGRVPINASGDLYVAAPKEHYDVFLLLPVAHRDYVGD